MSIEIKLSFNHRYVLVEKDFLSVVWILSRQDDQLIELLVKKGFVLDSKLGTIFH